MKEFGRDAGVDAGGAHRADFGAHRGGVRQVGAQQLPQIAAAGGAAAPAGIPDRRWNSIKGGGADRDDLLAAALAVGAFADGPPDRITRAKKTPNPRWTRRPGKGENIGAHRGPVPPMDVRV